LDTRSAASRCCGSSRLSLGLQLAVILFTPGTLVAQLTTGVVEGTLRGIDGSPLSGAQIQVTGRARFRTVVRSDANGEFAMTLPYGWYQISGKTQPGAESSGTTIFIAPLQTSRVDLVIDASGAIHSMPPAASATQGIWTDATSGRIYPEAFSLPGLLLSREPSSVTQPLDFTGLSGDRLAIESQRGFSWSDTQYKLQGMDATDSYQPGLPAILPDVQALDAVVVRSAFAQTTSSSPGTEVGLFLSEPGMSWHGSLSDASTASAFSSTNLLPPGRGLVQQVDQFRWFSRDRLEIGGPLTRWADFYASGSGQWASQALPLAPGTDQRSRLLFGNARGRMRAGAGDQFDALYSGSRIDLSQGGVPAGLEALTGNRMAPSFVLPGGFLGEPETDHLDFLQVGWTHLLSAASGPGIVQVRYGYAIAHLDSSTAPTGQSRIELLGGMVTGAPPLANMAVRPRHQIEAAWQPPTLHAKGTRHQIVTGGGWKTSESRNRFTTPSDTNLITANGAPAFIVEFNTPLDSRERVQSFSGYFADHLSLPRSLSLDVGAVAATPMRGARAAARSWTGPVVFRARNVAPDNKVSATRVTPVHRP